METNAPPQRPKNLCQVADYLLSPQSGLKKRDGVFNEQRVIYFRGNDHVRSFWCLLIITKCINTFFLITIIIIIII